MLDGVKNDSSPRASLDYDLEEWMSLMVTDDRSGLRARREDGRLHFSHQAAVFVLARA